MKNLLAGFAMSGLILAGLSGITANGQNTALQGTDHLTVPQWVSPKVPGELSGRVILPTANGVNLPIADAVVVMTDSNGQSVQSHTDEAGQFLLQDVAPGVYALTARGSGVFACCAMHVIDRKMAAADQFPTTVEIAAAAIDYTVAKASIMRYLPPYAGAAAPASVTHANLKAISARVAGQSNFRVAQYNGGLQGRIYAAGAEGKVLEDAGLLNVLLFQAGQVVDRVMSDRSGGFEFANLNPGEYGILAIGESGLGIAGLELVDQTMVNRMSSHTDRNVHSDEAAHTLVTAKKAAMNQPSPAGFSMQIAPLSVAIESFNKAIADAPTPMDSTIANGPTDMFVDQFGNPIGGGGAGGGPMGGGYGYGGGGFGGGGGGGGGFGGLGGLAAIGGIAAIAASDRNNNDVVTSPPAPASPSR